MRDAVGRETPPSVTMMAGYMELRNNTSRRQVLVAASSSGFETVTIHRTIVNGRHGGCGARAADRAYTQREFDLNAGRLSSDADGPGNGYFAPATRFVINLEFTQRALFTRRLRNPQMRTGNGSIQITRSLARESRADQDIPSRNERSCGSCRFWRLISTAPRM